MITIDLDINKLYGDLDKYLKVYIVQNLLFNLKYVFREYKIRISSSKKGVHIKIDVECSSAEEMSLRTWFKDDITRIKADLERKRLNLRDNILFFEKDGKTAGEWKTIKTDDDIVEFIEEFFNYDF